MRENALRQLLAHARSRSPFYARFHRGLEGAPLSDIPVLTKGRLMDEFDSVVTDRDILLSGVERYVEGLPAGGLYLGRFRVCSTSGTTGRRGLFLFGRDEWGLIVASFRRGAAWSGIPTGSVFAPGAAVVSPVPWHMSAQLGSPGTHRWMRFERMEADEPLDVMVERLNRRQPRTLFLYPSIGRLLAHEQLEERLRICPRFVFTGAEVLTPSLRGLLERAWGKVVFNHYGATETGLIASECSRGRMHAADDLLVLEAVDRDNRPVPPGTVSDKLLVTTLFRPTQPLIRYEISDRIVFSPDSCECGLPWRIIDSIEGRKEEVLRLRDPSGAVIVVNPVVFEKVLESVAKGGWQLRVEESLLHITIADARGADPEKVAAEMRRELEEHGVSAPEVKVAVVDQLQRSATGKLSHFR